LSKAGVRHSKSALNTQPETFGLAYAHADSNDSFREALHQALLAGGPHLIELVVS
jgi:thiamine pyrophosphate-dependent acetolactate synthase large subunit-like protein